MIMNRFGDDHIRSFKEIARFGKPTFIDKPIASSLQEAIEISKIAKEFNTPITSHSPLEFSKEFNEIKVTYRKMIESKEKSILIFSGPAECNDIGDDPRFKSPLFYGIHLSEMLSNICSDDLKKKLPYTLIIDIYCLLNRVSMIFLLIYIKMVRNFIAYRFITTSLVLNLMKSILMAPITLTMLNFCSNSLRMM